MFRNLHRTHVRLLGSAPTLPEHDEYESVSQKKIMGAKFDTSNRKGDFDMKRIINATENFNKKDAINMRNGLPLKDEPSGKTFNISKAAVVEDTDEETGELKNVSVLIDSDGKCYTAISATVADIMSDCIELLDAGESVTLQLIKRKSNAGREFLTFQVM